jgi:hypothetical protein
MISGVLGVDRVSALTGEFPGIDKDFFLWTSRAPCCNDMYLFVKFVLAAPRPDCCGC